MITNVMKLTMALHEVSMFTQFSVTSWWRSVQRNVAVGGVAKSKHLFGEAVDVVAAEPLVFKKKCDEVGLRVVDEGDHLHVELK